MDVVTHKYAKYSHSHLQFSSCKSKQRHLIHLGNLSWMDLSLKHEKLKTLRSLWRMLYQRYVTYCKSSKLILSSIKK
jgi:hypothetical protein